MHESVSVLALLFIFRLWNKSNKNIADSIKSEGYNNNNNNKFISSKKGHMFTFIILKISTDKLMLRKQLYHFNRLLSSKVKLGIIELLLEALHLFNQRG